MARIPPLNKPMYFVYFYHTITGDSMRYKFMSYSSALAFYNRLAPVSKPTIHVIERIL